MIRPLVLDRLLAAGWPLAGALWLATVVAWLADVAAGWSFDLLSRLLVVATLIATAAALARSARRSLAGARAADGRWLLALLALALAVRWIGIDHEVAERYYLDEGTYHHHASEINAGEVLRARFVYPHLLYYLDALILWAMGLFRPLVDGLAAAVYGLTDPLAVDWLVLRGAVALLSAAAVLPVYRLGALLQGRFAAVLGSLLLIFSTPFNEGSHLMISDVPSAVLATFSLWFAVRAGLEDERRDYLAAGLFAGLAAATKYPAGVVAVAIVAAWLGARWTRRSWSWDLLWSGLVAVAAFVAVMPSLLVYAENAFLGGQGIFFGVRQYAGGGWIGVLPRSNLAYYLGQLADSVGWIALASALAGLALALVRGGRPPLRRLLWIVPFPLIFLALIVSMTVVVKRNLFPALPALCVIVALLAGYLGQRLPASGRRGRWAQGAFGALLLAVPVWQTALQSVSLARPGTRVLARQRIEATLPTGAYVVKESYTPDLPHELFWVHQGRFVPRLGLERLEDPAVDFILVSSNAFQRFFVAEAFKQHHLEYRRTYERLFAEHPLVWELEPSPLRDGPYLRLYLGGPVEPSVAERLDLTPGDAFVPAEEMQGDGEIAFTAPGQWAVFKGYLAAGPYRLRSSGRLPLGSRLVVERLAEVGPAGRVRPVEPGPPVAAGAIEGPEGALALELPVATKVLLRVELPPGGTLTGLTVEPIGSASSR